MDLLAYLKALRASWWAVLVAVVLGALGGLALFFATPPVYASTVQFYVTTPASDGTSVQSAGQFAQARVNSYVILLSSTEMARKVIDAADVDLTPEQVSSRVTAVADINTVFVTATVEDTDRARALEIARGLQETFPAYAAQLDNIDNRTAVVVSVTSPAALESSPVSPRLTLNLGIGIAAGLVLGIAFALARELLNTSMRSAEDVQEHVGAPLLAHVDFDPDSKNAPLVVAEQSMSGRAEAFRQLRTNLQFIDAATATDVVLVTSSVPAEGKSTTAANLAVVFTERRERVLLVEADMRRPRVADYLGLSRDIGLSNVLAGQIALEDAVQPWGTDGLHLLASGSIPPNPAELLGSERMTELIAEARHSYDRVVVDLPPVLPVTDAAVLAATGHVVVLVVRHGATRKSQVASAARSLSVVGAHIVGGVLTMRKVKRSERKLYGEGTYYGRDTPPAGAPMPVTMPAAMPVTMPVTMPVGTPSLRTPPAPLPPAPSASTLSAAPSEAPSEAPSAPSDHLRTDRPSASGRTPSYDVRVERPAPRDEPADTDEQSRARRSRRVVRPARPSEGNGARPSGPQGDRALAGRGRDDRTDG